MARLWGCRRCVAQAMGRRRDQNVSLWWEWVLRVLGWVSLRGRGRSEVGTMGGVLVEVKLVLVVVQVLAGMPVDVRIIESSVGENSRLDEAFAALNLAATKFGSDSVRSNNIFLDM